MTEEQDRNAVDETVELDHPTEPVEEISDSATSTTTETAQPKRGSPPITARTELPFGLVFILLVALLVVVFTVQNTNDVSVQFIGWSGRFPLAVVIIAVVIATVIIDEVAGVFLRRRRRRRVAEKEELRRLRESQ